MDRNKIKHLLRLGCWGIFRHDFGGIFLGHKMHYMDLTQKYFYMCGSNILAIEDSKEDLTNSIKKSDLESLYPKIIFHPKENDECFVLAIGPVGNGVFGPMSFGFQPEELRYIPKDDYDEFIEKQIITLLWINKRGFLTHVKIPKDIMKLIFNLLKDSSGVNTGFV